MANEFQSRAQKGTAHNVAEYDIAMQAPTITQASHGFDHSVVRESADGVYTGAQADSDANIGVGGGLAISQSASQFTLIRWGAHQRVTWTGHGLGSSFETKLYLSASTAGAIVASAPGAGNRIVYLGYIVDANTIQWEPGLRF